MSSRPSRPCSKPRPASAKRAAPTRSACNSRSASSRSRPAPRRRAIQARESKSARGEGAVVLSAPADAPPVPLGFLATATATRTCSAGGTPVRNGGNGAALLLPTTGSAFLRSPLLSHELEQQLVLLATGRTSLQVRPHPRKRRFRREARDLELDVAVERGEALLAAHLRPSRAEHPGKPPRQPSAPVPEHHQRFSSGERRSSYSTRRDSRAAPRRDRRDPV